MTSCGSAEHARRSSARQTLERDGISLNHHRALVSCLSMIYAQTRSAFVARENRFTLCADAALRVRIVL
jgi:hypothetical protein